MSLSVPFWYCSYRGNTESRSGHTLAFSSAGRKYHMT